MLVVSPVISENTSTRTARSAPVVQLAHRAAQPVQPVVHHAWRVASKDQNEHDGIDDEGDDD